MEENRRERWKKAVLPERDTKMGFYLNSRAPYVLYEGRRSHDILLIRH